MGTGTSIRGLSNAYGSLGSRDDLSGVALGVLGGVKEQSDDGRWKSRTADRPRLVERIERGRPNLVERSIDRARRRSHQRHELIAWEPRTLFLIKRRSLVTRQALAARIGEQAVEAAGQVAEMKSDRCGAAGPCPDVVL